MTTRRFGAAGAAPSRQRGLTFLGVALVAVAVVLLATVGLQSALVVKEYLTIRKAATRAVRESATPLEVRAAFDRAAAIDDITSLAGRDLDITGGAGQGLAASYSYSREIHLAGPVSLLYRFHDSVK